jgi:hypothetical protein
MQMISDVFVPALLIIIDIKVITFSVFIMVKINCCLDCNVNNG